MLVIKNLTAEFVRHLLCFDRNTGLFTWKNPPRMGRAKYGRIAGSQKGTRTSGFYLHIQINRVHYLSHHLAWLYEYGEYPVNRIDHINGDGTDNRISNLRDVTLSVNAENRRHAASTNKTGFLGVHFHKVANKYVSEITVNKKKTHLGLFESPEEAYAVYLESKRKLHIGCSI